MFTLSRRIALILLFALWTAHATQTVSWADRAPKAIGAQPAWRSGWLFMDDKMDAPKLIAGAKDLQLQAIVFGAPAARMTDIISQIQGAKMETYYWFGPVSPPNAAAYQQQLSAKEKEALQSMTADNARFEHGYQGGGEPVTGHIDIWEGTFPCFHRPETVEATLASLRKTLEAYPGLDGIALDGFGYQNLHDCQCPESQRQAAAYVAAHPKLDPAAARDQFFLETLIGFQNRLAAEARKIRPDIKLAAHVWPTYAPKPLYGHNLDLDHCAQTTAWFFKPHWSDEKITAYTRTVVNEAKQIHKRQEGVPFIGYAFSASEWESKSADRLEHELRTVFQATPSRSFSIFSLSDLLANPDAVAAVHKVYREFGVGPVAR